jgi:hypothetical protein
MTEKAVLDDVLDDGELLLLADGRRLAVKRADSIAASIWFPEARLTLRKLKKATEISVTNDDTGESVLAKLVTRKR